MKKRILGVVGLIIVAVMTIYAYSMPEPETETVSEKDDTVATNNF